MSRVVRTNRGGYRSPPPVLRLTTIGACLCALAATPLLPGTAGAAPLPVVDCITPSGTADGVWQVYFGYVNTGGQTTVAFGDDNQIVPGLGFQGQPSVFNEGSYPRVLRALFNANAFTGVSWVLGGSSAQATLASPRCRAGATGPASDVTTQSATLHGLVEPEGADTAYLFNYGTTIAYGSTTPERRTSATAQVAEPLTGLLPGTTYHYRLVASGSMTTVGEDRTFTTPPVPAPPATTTVVQTQTVTQPASAPAASSPPPAAAAAGPVLTDLAVIRSRPRARVRRGATLTLRFTILNRGPATATNAGFVDRLGEGLRLRSARGPAGRCMGRTVVRCPLGTLAAGRAARVTLRVQLIRAGRLSDTAVVAADQPDSRVADNAATGTQRVSRARPRGTR